MENVYTEDFLRNIDVRDLLPQRDPFVMIDRLTHFDMNTSTTELVVSQSKIFVDNGRFSPCGMMENMAQTCAARLGFYNKYILKKEVQVGFIGAVRNYVIEELAPVGSTISTTVDIIEEVFGMTLAQARVKCGGKVIATAEIKLSVRNLEKEDA